MNRCFQCVSGPYFSSLYQNNAIWFHFCDISFYLWVTTVLGNTCNWQFYQKFEYFSEIWLWGNCPASKDYSLHINEWNPTQIQHRFHVIQPRARFKESSVALFFAVTIDTFLMFVLLISQSFDSPDAINVPPHPETPWYEGTQLYSTILIVFRAKYFFVVITNVTHCYLL